ncbi:hypothetical protein J6V85_02850 [Candidatus Saccharibacteria bacterium]|nr:hypothetical protein [Candidatus Saccharibacteria bacterium]
MSRGKTEVVIMPEEQVYDEADIREYIEFIRKHPVTSKPRLADCWDWDVFCLKAKSYNRHNKNGDSVDLGGEDFHDKRFAEILGDDY